MDETGPSISEFAGPSTPGIPAGEAQGVVPVNLPDTSNAPDNGIRDGVLNKWFKDSPVWKAEQAARGITSEGTPPAEVTPATTIPVTVPPTPPAVDPYANTADLNTPSPELLQMARDFAPVLEQFKQQGFSNADALTRAQTEFQLKQTIEGEQTRLYQQYDAAVNEGKMEPEMAERLYLAEARALESTHRANHIMQQAAQQAQTAMLQQVRTQYPRLPAETITQVMGALPGEAGANLLGRLSAQIDATLQAEMTKQATAAAIAQAQAPARTAGAASTSPGSAFGAKPAPGFTWMGWLQSQGAKP